MTRILAEMQYNLIKTATRKLIRAAGGVEGASLITRAGKSVLSDYQNVSKTEFFMPADIVADLESETGCRFVSEALSLVRSSDKKPEPLSSFPLQISEILKQTGDVVQQAGAANIDGRITFQERRAICKEISEAMIALTKAYETLSVEECADE